MAGGIKFNRTIRKIHLGASMIIFAFLFMFVFSGFFMVNRTLFDVPEFNDSFDTVQLSMKPGTDPSAYAKFLEDEFDLKGRKEYRQDWKKNWIFGFYYPGENTVFTIPPGQDSAFVKVSKQERTFFTVVHQMHVLRGFKGGWPYTVWAVFYDAAFVAMFVFAITGILLWWRARRRYKYGWWFLAFGIVVPLLFMLFYTWTK